MTTKVVAVQNIKGGVGKTTVAVNLAAVLASRHAKKVLLIDVDAQSNASLYLLDDDEFDARTKDGPKEVGTLYDLFSRDLEVLNIVTGTVKRATPRPKALLKKEREFEDGGSLHFVAASPALFDIQDLPPELCVERIPSWLRQIKKNFDVVIFDCPPRINAISLSALKASDSILVPMKADLFSLQGLPILVKSIRRYAKVFGLSVTVGGVLLTLYPKEKPGRIKADRYRKEIAEFCAKAKLPILNTHISEDSLYPESYDHREPLPFQAASAVQPLVDELDALARELSLA